MLIIWKIGKGWECENAWQWAYIVISYIKSNPGMYICRYIYKYVYINGYEFHVSRDVVSLAIQHLDKVRWHDKQIRVAASKHNNVQMPKEGQPDAGLTKDYSQSPLHRFKKPGSKNYMNIYPPSATLHLSNIPPNITEEYLTSAFEQNGLEVKGFKFFP